MLEIEFVLLLQVRAAAHELRHRIKKAQYTNNASSIEL